MYIHHGQNACPIVSMLSVNQCLLKDKHYRNRHLIQYTSKWEIIRKRIFCQRFHCNEGKNSSIGKSKSVQITPHGFIKQTVKDGKNLPAVLNKLLTQYRQTIFTQKVSPTMTVMDRNISTTSLLVSFIHFEFYNQIMLSNMLRHLYNKT